MMNENDLKSELNPGLKKLGIGFVADHTPYGVEEAKWKVMQSILLTLVMSGAIRVNVSESDGKTVVSGYMFVEKHLPEVPHDELLRIDHEAISEAREKYPFLDVILKAGFKPKIKGL
ncbi:hypothetical protein [Lepagella muris]|jgi:hypothetical protein|uniref:Uncharacterized protein n=1 Tax=Lepagella muris TaxID=3032870 RepID=A0AC61RIG9_9BACT|nr:hypothetical protein [Lepagella muris]TGY80932.1 hypothetical protein E5331_00705 [Lepagella muris]THG54010.1 hypothetical protein E5984_00705 [Bacteroidales bacterium]